MLDWSTIETTIQTWVATASGVPTIWEAQGAPRPDGPYISLNATVRNVGWGFGTYVEDTDANSGEELVETRYQVKDLTLTMQCFAVDAVGNGRPSAILDNVLDHAELQTVRDLLSAAGWVPARKGEIQFIGGVIGGTVFEPRARVQCIGQVTGQVTGVGTYIQTIDITNDITGSEFSLDSEA